MTGGAVDAPDDGPDARRQFVAVTGWLWVAAFVGGALLAPPDPVTQVLTTGPFLVASPLLAYWLVYRHGAERARTVLDRDG
jgi:Sec-independent protein secretion pathway component TatC